MWAVPPVIGMRVVIIRIRVDFPAPLGPSSPKISPSPTLNEMSSTAVKSPYFLTMCDTAIAGVLDVEPLLPFGF